MNQYLQWAAGVKYRMRFKSNLEYYEYQLAYAEYTARYTAHLWHKLNCLRKVVKARKNWANLILK